MQVTRSPVLAAVLVIAAVGLCYHAFFRAKAKTPQQEERELGRWLVCLDCGHQWTMNPKEMMAERMKDPSGLRLVTCPKCHARRGVKAWKCQRCGKLIPRLMDNPEPGASPPLVRRYLCDECAAVEGGQPNSAQDTLPDD
jgi:DNA-directed RNA polymerase subunit RPC12/RpoP